jgi:3-hydroxy-9,10-secoandrosta-1,3,5(10)-triene-9,17-dione monooxygenase
MSIVSGVSSRQLVERAAGLVPMLREQAPLAEQARRVAPETFDALSEAGVFRMTAPVRYGGFEADFQTQCDVLAEIARACPSTSWVATILSAMSWLVGVFPDATQDEIFADGDPRISGVFSPTGTAVPAKGGFVVSGRWGFNTGGHGSKWTVLNAIVPTSDGGGMPTCVIAPSRELRRLDDWHASGMAATGSDTITAKDLFVPVHRTMPLPQMLAGTYPPRHNASNPYFNYPLAPVLNVNAGGTPVGAARGALEAFHERLPGRGITYTNYTIKSEAAVTHLQVADATLKLDSAEAHVRLACDLLDNQGREGTAGTQMSVVERVRSRAHISYATGLSREVVDTLFYASGASAIQSSVPIQRFQRDIQVLANHAIMHPQTAIELYGRVLCGLAPNTVLY